MDACDAPVNLHGMLCGDQTTAYIAAGRGSEEVQTGNMMLADHLYVHQQPPCLWLICVLILSDLRHVHILPCLNAVQAELVKLLDCGAV